MKIKKIWLFLIPVIMYSIVTSGPTPFGLKAMASQIKPYEGRLFTGPKDPEYKNYDLALKNCLIKRIQQKYGVELSPGSYSGYDLLEIESLIRVKKSHEPLAPFLKMFPKSH